MTETMKWVEAFKAAVENDESTATKVADHAVWQWYIWNAIQRYQREHPAR
ncbi:MAG: hypothetical protein ACTS6J_12050 [Burkholderiales bacterium]